MLKTSFTTSVSRLLRGSLLKSYVDKRLVNGLKIYFDAVVDIELEPVKYSLDRLNRAISPVYQGKVENIISEYTKMSGTETQMKFMGLVVMISIMTELKIYEIATRHAARGLDKYGISTQFLGKLVDGVDLIDSVSADPKLYLVEASKADIRYLEVGLKRLLGTEVDSIV